jgi:uncharacterized protein YciI
MTEPSQFLYRIQPSRPGLLREGPTPEEAEVIEQHAAYVGDLTERGVVQLAGRTLNTDPSAFGIVIFRAESEQAARTIMQQDPAVKHGVMAAELFPYRISFAGKLD